LRFQYFQDNEVESAADPDPGSRDFNPWIRNPCPGSGVKNNTDPGARIRDKHIRSYFQELVTIILFRNTQILSHFSVTDLDPGSGKEKSRSGIRDEHPRFATLEEGLTFLDWPSPHT
jgi:hypothetical protein